LPQGKEQGFKTPTKFLIWSLYKYEGFEFPSQTNLKNDYGSLKSLDACGNPSGERRKPTL
jgi:hypothetical protein